MIIGAESVDAGLSVATTASSASAWPPVLAPSLGSDAGSAAGDGAPVACLPDGGCPVGSVCEYPVEAGCGAAGECFASGIYVPPPPLGPTAVPGSPSPNQRRRRLSPADEAYSPFPPSCDGGDLADGSLAPSDAGKD